MYNLTESKTWKNKASKIITICLAVIAAALLISLLWLILNPVSYYEFEEDGYTFNYKGSFGKARRVVIKENGEKISTVSIKSDSDIFDSLKDFDAIIVDLNGDGDEDILLPTDYDDEGDAMYSVLLSSGAKFKKYEDAALANPTFNADDGMIYTTETIKLVIEEKTEISPEFYELTERIAKHRFDEGGTLITQSERSLIYYSESDYYCYAIYEYSEETKDLAYVDEIWFDPIKLDKYPLIWD